MSSVKRRVAAIGLDAAEWWLVDELCAAGELPHFAALLRRGAFARLDNTAHYRTGLVWEHFVTGRGAAAAARFAAVEFDPARYEVWQEGARGARPFYDAAPPLTAILFDVPYVSLARVVDGAAVTGWGGHDPGYPRAAHPPGLLREIDARFGPHPAFDNDYGSVSHRARDLDALADALVVGARRRADVALWLMRRRPDWELFATVLSEPHSAGEHMWHGVDPAHPAAALATSALAGRRLREVYRAVDDALGRIVAALPRETTVVAFSPFGMEGNVADVASMALLPELLFRHGFGRPLLRDVGRRAWERGGRAPLVLDASRQWSAWLRDRVPRPPGRRRARLLRLLGRGRPAPAPAPVPQARGALGRPIAAETQRSPAQIGVPRSSVGWQFACRYRGHWPRMRAFALPSFYDGRIRLNVTGREAAGRVAPADYIQTCRELEALLRACRDPRTGRAAVAEVLRLRAADPLARGGPDADLQVVWREPVDALEHPALGTLGPLPYRRTGGHSPRGFAVIAGPGIAPCDLGERDALDVAPTLLALLGRDPSRCDGKPLLAPLR